MIFLYTALLLVLTVTRFLVKRHAAALERKYTRAAVETEKLVRLTSYRDGNSGRADPCLAAKRQLQLGQQVQKRDRIESRYTTWQTRAERLDRLTRRLRDWKGKTLPYTLGVLDVALAFTLIDWLGAGQIVSVRNLWEMTRTVFVR
jgi:hypothetical protein